MPQKSEHPESISENQPQDQPPIITESEAERLLLPQKSKRPQKLKFVESTEWQIGDVIMSNNL